METANAETHTVKILFAGDEKYKPGNVEVSVVIEKASSSVKVSNKQVTYSGDSYNLQNMLNFTPEGIDQGIDLNAVSELMDLVSQILRDTGLSSSSKLTIYLDGNPSSAGLYLVGAATTDPNYETALGIGYLFVGPKLDDVTMSFDKNKEFDGINSVNVDGTLLVSNVVEGDDAELHFSSKGEKLKRKRYR